MKHIYLCNNEMYLELFLSKLPDKFEVDLDLVILTDENNRDKIKIFEHLVEKYQPTCYKSVTYEDDGPIMELARKELDLEGNVILDTYELAVKLLLPWYYMNVQGDEKMFYSDDDLVILNDPSRYLKKKDVFVHNGMSNLGDLKEFNELKRIFRMKDITPEQYNKGRTDAGFYVMSKKDDYVRQVKEAFHSEFYTHLFNVRNRSLKNGKRYWVLKGRYFDQRFFSMYMRKYKAESIRPQKNNYYAAFENFYKIKLHSLPKNRPTFIHYMTQSYKKEYVQWFSENL